MAESLRSRLKLLEFLWYGELRISTVIRAYYRKHYKKDYYLYKSVASIGGITHSALIAERVGIKPFNRLEKN